MARDNLGVVEVVVKDVFCPIVNLYEPYNDGKYKVHAVFRKGEDDEKINELEMAIDELARKAWPDLGKGLEYKGYNGFDRVIIPLKDGDKQTRPQHGYYPGWRPDERMFGEMKLTADCASHRAPQLYWWAADKHGHPYELDRVHNATDIQQHFFNGCKLRQVCVSLTAYDGDYRNIKAWLRWAQCAEQPGVKPAKTRIVDLDAKQGPPPTIDSARPKTIAVQTMRKPEPEPKPEPKPPPTDGDLWNMV